MDANRSSISQATSDEQIGEFWATHDFTVFDDPNAPDIPLIATCAVPVDEELLTALEKQARQRGIRVETLVNLWLQQKLFEQVQPQPA